MALARTLGRILPGEIAGAAALSSGMRRALGMQLIQAMAPELLSAASMVRVLRRAGLSYRTTTMLSDIRRFTGRMRHESSIRALAPNQVVPFEWMSDVRLERPVAYRVYGDATYYNEITGETETVVRSFYTDSLTRLDNWERDYIEYVPYTDTDPVWRVTSFKTFGVERNTFEE